MFGNPDTESPAAPGPADVADVITWIESRKRQPFNGCWPLRGFGPTGMHTMFVVPSTDRATTRFRDGKAETIMAEAALPEEIRQLGLAVLKSFDVRRLTISTEFLTYASRLLCNSYNLSDGDLEFLLLSGGEKWHRDVVEHLCGGQAAFERLKKVEGPPRLEPTPATRPFPFPPPPRRSILRRLFGR